MVYVDNSHGVFYFCYKTILSQWGCSDKLHGVFCFQKVNPKGAEVIKYIACFPFSKQKCSPQSGRCEQMHGVLSFQTTITEGQM